MANALAQASGTEDVQLLTGRQELTSFSCRETATVPAAASCILRDGTSTSGVPVIFIELVADGDRNIAYSESLEFENGIFLDRVAGECSLTIHVR